MATITLPKKAKTFHGFDYPTLKNAPLEAEAKAAATRIRQLHSQAQISFIAVGRELSKIKGKVKHGSFLDWIKLEFGMEPRTAQRYMMVAERFQDREKLVTSLPARVQYALAAPSTPAPYVDQLLAGLECGYPLPVDISQEIAEAKHVAASLKDAPASAVSETATHVTPQQAAKKAVTLLKKKLGVSFAEFITLMAKADLPHFAEALDNASANLGQPNAH